MTTKPTPLSVLDLAPVPAGGSAPQALRNAVDLARHAEAWGYRRYWVAEHHFVAVASVSPAVLIGQVLAATSSIRVGSAAVQLGYTTTAAVAESFGTLAALYPDRVDLGLGRSAQRKAQAREATADDAQRATPPPREVDGVLVPAPFDPSRLLARPRVLAGLDALIPGGAETPSFSRQVGELEDLISGRFAVSGTALRSRVAEAVDGPLWIFGSSAGESAAVAGARGLPFVANYHVSPATTLDAVAAYREAFTPGALDQPHVVVSADVVVAGTDQEAATLAAGYPKWVHSIRFGDGAIEFPTDSNDLTDEQRAAVADRTDTQFVGAASTVAERLRALGHATGADELVVTSVTHDHAARLRSHELLAKEWGIL
ncbi:LLM class flavin-dependent oxidoreductase [Tsukamurella sp. 8F]|uniref:LLM class flavin-dependent oxidoreductase n=1 Tax=unclassified Tsukamurella TaxID=2633480 RepID=UPI0023B9F0B5|nr:MULTISPECIES: LLM class flavin-dependent oxidoreductase [unclassified Tsukamurella]MDF0530579.1 LLM class flavin-dependent oxidoreductase [Tsukamurella sp. 8J]MDF0586771.1 LLM class flavin-dependent oxidoreductase [Tsukamurella sp. 8F]